MGLRPPVAGLRPVRLRYDSKQPYKGRIVVQPGDELEVSEDLADQLRNDDTHFRTLEGETPEGEELEGETPEVEGEEPEGETPEVEGEEIEGETPEAVAAAEPEQAAAAPEAPPAADEATPAKPERRPRKTS